MEDVIKYIYNFHSAFDSASNMFNVHKPILYRAKAINRDPENNYRSSYKNGDWVYGLVTRQYNPEYKLPAEMTDIYGTSRIEVDYTTISIFTGLFDINNIPVFEKDIIELNDRLCVVLYQTYKAAFDLIFVHQTKDFDPTFKGADMRDIPYRYVVIGNFYDNPELIDKDALNT